MKNIKSKMFGIAMILCLGVLLSACGDKTVKEDKVDEKKVEEKVNKEEKKDTNEKVEEKAQVKEPLSQVSLEEWKGEWNNIQGYLDKDEVKKAVEEKAKEESKSADDFLKAFNERRKADFMGVKIEGDKLILLDKFPSDNGKEIEKLSYKYLESHSVKHGNSDLEWHVFETEDKDEYKYLLMMPVHGEDEIVHFHMRYGMDKDQLLKDDKWYPTMVKPSSTMQQVVTEITE